MSYEHRHGSATGVAVAVRRSCVKSSCLTIGPLASLLEEDLTVTISPELEAQILRYHHVEKWRVGTIAVLEKFPTLTASRLYVMVRERGYPGES